MGSIIRSQNIMGSDHGSSISALHQQVGSSSRQPPDIHRARRLAEKQLENLLRSLVATRSVMAGSLLCRQKSFTPRETKSLHNPFTRQP
jgi:hypothetical protein